MTKRRKNIGPEESHKKCREPRTINWSVMRNNVILISKKKIINKLDMDRQDEFAFRVSWPSGIVDVSPACWRWS